MTSPSGLSIEVDHAAHFRTGEDVLSLRPKERAVIGAIVVHHPEPVAIDEVIEFVWGDAPPRSARASVHNHLARLRGVAPDLVAATRAGYRIDGDVRVELDDGVDAHAVRIALGLSDHPNVRRSCAAFVERWDDVSDGFPAAIRRGAVDSIIDQLERDAIADPTDERLWWRVMVAHAVSGRRAQVRVARDALRRHLADVGLEPSRRIADVMRLADHDVRDPTAYLADPFGGPVDRFLHRESGLRSDVDRVRTAIVGERHHTLDVIGAADHRREVLRRVVDAVRLDGIDATIVSCTPQMLVAPDPPTDPDRDRPAVVVLDGIDHLPDTDFALRRARSSMRPSEPSAVIVVCGRAEPAPGEHVALTLVPVDGESVATDAVGGRQDRVDADLADVVATLSVLDEPVAPATLARLVDGTAVDRAMRIGVVHHDHANDLIAARVPGDRRSTDAAARAAVIDRVLGLELADTALASGSRHLRLLVELLGITTESTRSVEIADRLRRTSFEFADRAMTDGSPTTAADALRRAFDAIDRHPASRHTPTWFDIAIRAGRAEHALARPSGPSLLRDVVLDAHGRGDQQRSAEALLELARLGPVATAGAADADALELFELLERSNDHRRATEAPVDARVGAAGAMILSFASDPERLRSVFDRAESEARRCGDRELVEVLPLAFMSLPLPDDIERRRSIADDLLGAADRLDDDAGRWEALHLAVAHAVMDGDPAFRRLTDEIAEVSSTLPERSRHWEGAYLDANRRLIDGDLDAARAASARQLELAGNVHPDRVAAVYGAAELAIALAEGTEAALAPVTAALADDQPEVGAWHAALAACAASAGDEAVSRAAIARCLDDGVLVRDHTYTAALLALGHAAVVLGDLATGGKVIERLDRYRGTWTWCGSTTFGPVDLTLARLARLLDRPGARDLAVDAVTSTAHLSAPIWNRLSIEELLVDD
ncbi:MAG: BTAD domain-containing putative transcriptional regulator [Actinomycetota bacterium]